MSRLNNLFSCFRDNVPVIWLATWDVGAKMFDGEIAAGPVPTIFSEDILATQEALASNYQRAHQDLQRAMKAFYMPELIGLDEALALVKKPR
jgi:hypothetical protein